LVTPNGDGINDYFEVAGIEKYHNSKFGVLLPNGKIIYEQTPYNNDYDGVDLSDGTYYFMFFGDKNDGAPLKKGFFELVRK
jgi:gliding motility-associated-like protein